MTEFVDTNLVLRYQVGEPPDQFDRAAAILDSDRLLYLTDVVIVEAAHALRTQYGLQREEIVDALVELVRKVNIRVLNMDRDVVVEALELCRPSQRVNFGDAMIWAAVRCTQPACVHSFDERFPRNGVDVRRP